MSKHYTLTGLMQTIMKVFRTAAGTKSVGIRNSSVTFEMQTFRLRYRMFEQTGHGQLRYPLWYSARMPCHCVVKDVGWVFAPVYFHSMRIYHS